MLLQYVDYRRGGGRGREVRERARRGGGAWGEGLRYTGLTRSGLKEL